METLERFITFFSTKYYSNLKYSNSVLASLRLFFERNNKISSSVTKLGNVYRNSKWADLKIVNIKASFLVQFFKNLFVVILTFNIFYKIIIFFVATIFCVNFSNTSNTWVSFQEWAQYYYIVLIFAAYWVYKCTLLKLSTWIDRNFLRIPDKKNPTKLSDENNLAATLYDAVFESVNLQFKTPCFLDKDKIFLFWQIQKCRLTVSRIETYIDFNSFNHSHTLIRNLDILVSLLGGKLPMDVAMRVVYMDVQQSVNFQPRQDFSITKNLDKYTELPSWYKLKFRPEGVDFDSSNSVNTCTTNYSYIQNFEYRPKKMLMDIIEKNINISKQSRWAWKSNILSDDFILKNRGVTTIKKLMGNSPRSSIATKRSIWLSNKMYNNKQFLQLNKSLAKPGVLTEFYVKNIHSNASLKTLDLYEQAMFWHAKRFRYTQGLNMNTQAIDNYKKVSLPELSSNLKQDLNINSLFFYYNTALDLNYLHKSNLEHYSLHNRLYTSQSKADSLHIKLVDPINFISIITPFFFMTHDYYTPTNNYVMLASGRMRFNMNLDYIQTFNFAKERNVPYSLDFSEQTIFSTGFNSLFGAHVANSIVFDNNTMLVFHNIFKQDYI